jgi:hypothetical protein
VHPHPVVMTPAEIWELRAHLGLTSKALGEAIGAHISGPLRWQDGGRRISREHADRLEALVAYTDRFVADLVATHPPGSTITVYRKDKDFREHIDTGPWVLTADWYRRAVRRAVEQIPGGRFDYAPADDSA